MSGSVSAVVPVYNVAPYVERCVDSLLNQTVPFSEILLIDDGSTDPSGTICDELAKRSPSIKVIHQANAGLGAARNRGISESRSEFISFVDSDDWIDPLFVETMLGIISSTGAEVAVCSMVRATTNDEYLQKAKRANEVTMYSADEFMDIMLRYKGNRCVHYACAKMYSANVLEPHHFPEGIYNEDVEGFFKCLLNVRTIAETNRTLYCYFANENSITGSAFGENYLCLEKVWARIHDIAEMRAPALLPKVEYNEKRACFTILCDRLVHGTVETDALYGAERAANQEKLKRNLAYLLKGPMPIGRKLFAVILAYCYPLLRFVARHLNI